MYMIVCVYIYIYNLNVGILASLSSEKVENLPRSRHSTLYRSLPDLVVLSVIIAVASSMPWVCWRQLRLPLSKWCCQLGCAAKQCPSKWTTQVTGDISGGHGCTVYPCNSGSAFRDADLASPSNNPRKWLLVEIPPLKWVSSLRIIMKLVSLPHLSYAKIFKHRQIGAPFCTLPDMPQVSTCHLLRALLKQACFAAQENRYPFRSSISL